MPVTRTLTLRCKDRTGIVASVTTALASINADIVESNQFSDKGSGTFFMRIAFGAPDDVSLEDVRRILAPVSERFSMTLDIFDQNERPRLLIMVSKFDHALLHLLYQVKVGWLPAEVVAIVSNHEDSRTTAEQYNIPYHYLPVDKHNKAEREAELLAIIEKTGAELVILARYMQVLSDTLSAKLSGRVINIHHSFLPSFKGAKPYHQAFDRGVKLIGATAHYVTADLDEGPIIEQETERVTHAMTAEDYVATGRDIESRVLARAVKYHVERRSLLNGSKTIVF